MDKTIGIFPGNNFRSSELTKKYSHLVPINFSNYTIANNGCSRVLIENLQTVNYKEKFESTYLKILAQIHRNYQIFYRFYVGATNYELFIRGLALETYLMIDMLERNKIRAIIFTTSVAHHYDSLVAELACKILKIPQIYLYNIAATNRLLPLVQNKGLEDRRPFGMKISKFNIGRVSDLFIDGHLSRTTLRQDKFKSLNQNIQKLKYFLFILFRKNRRSFFDAHVSISKDIAIFLRQKKALKSLNYFSKIDSKIFSKKQFYSQHFIIIYAHFQPEATTFPEGDPYTNHVDLVAAIREKGFSGEIIFKEHPEISKSWDYAIGSPTRVGLYRSDFFYQQLKNLGCTIINTDSLEDTLNKATSYSVVTISGTIALEFAAEGRKIIVAGNPWFKRLPNCVNFEEVLNLASVNSAVKNQTLKDQCDNYISALCNKKTLSNYFGIASNSINFDWKTFDKEFSALLGQLAKII